MALFSIDDGADGERSSVLATARVQVDRCADDERHTWVVHEWVGELNL